MARMRNNDNRNNTKGTRRNRRKGFDKSNKDNECYVEDGYNNKVPQGTNNDAAWYGFTPQLVKDAASLSFSLPVGNHFDLLEEDPRNNTIKSLFKNQSIPGVMALELVPTPGVSKGIFNPVDTASRNIYSFVRHANSGHSNYEHQDLMMYLLAMDSIYSFYAFMVRAYGMLRDYAQSNRYYPEALLKACKLNPDDFSKNIADFRFYINQFAIKIGSMCVPNCFNYMTRHQWLYSNIYLDSGTSKAQSYIFVPKGFHRYTWEKDAQNVYMGKLSFEYLGSDLTFAKLKEYGDNLIKELLLDEDCNIMSGDILKAFGSEGLFKVTTVPEDYVVVPVCNVEVLTQIQNATIVSQFNDVPQNRFDVSQSMTEHKINFIPWFSESDPTVKDAFKAHRVLNMCKDGVTPEEVMVATRLMTNFHIMGDNSVYVNSCGSEICVNAKIFKIVGTRHERSLISVDVPGLFKTTNDLAVLKGWLNVFSELCAFAFHPMMQIAYTSSDNEMNLRSFEYDNIAVVEKQTLDKMHDTALLSLFAVPQMGKATPNQK